MSPSGNRSRPPAIAAASSTPSPQWSSLPMDLVRLVGCRVLAGDLLHYVRFRAACTHWRSSTVSPRGRGIVDPRFHPRPWMILPEGHNSLHPGDDMRRFFNLSTGSFARVRLPLLTDHRVLVSVDGLLLLRLDRRDDAVILLLHLFTGDTVKLPPLLEDYWAMVPGVRRRHCFVPHNFVASLSVSADGTVVVMIVHQYMTCVFFATTNDKQWNVSSWNLTPLSRPISFQGKLYILAPHPTFSSGHMILQLDPPRHEHAKMSSSLMPPTSIATCPSTKYRHLFCLAECDSEILVIGFEKDMGFSTDIVVYRLADLAKGKFTPVTSIGGNTLFLDIETSKSVQNGDIVLSKSMTSSYKAMPSIVSDTIVCLGDDYPLQYHNMADGCNCGLIYHIYGCCHCNDKKGSSYEFKV